MAIPNLLVLGNRPWDPGRAGSRPRPATCDRRAMTMQAYAVIVLVPLLAVLTLVLAWRPGRPTAGRGWSTAAIQARLQELDAGPGAVQDKATVRERRQLRTELLRRGVGR